MSPLRGFYHTELIQQTTNWCFSYFSQETGVDISLYCLHWIQFAWNVKMCFLEKMIKIFQNVWWFVFTQSCFLVSPQVRNTVFNQILSLYGQPKIAGVKWSKVKWLPYNNDPQSLVYRKSGPFTIKYWFPFKNNDPLDDIMTGGNKIMTGVTFLLRIVTGGRYSSDVALLRWCNEVKWFP